MKYQDLKNTKNKVMNKALEVLEPTIEKMADNVKEAYRIKYEEKGQKFVWTEYEEEFTKINLVFDLYKAIEKYTDNNDELIEIESSTSAKGNIAINSVINRGDENYDFSTEVIYAGGYNIQRLHLRYITSTTLPRTGNNEITIKIKESIKKANKLKDLQSEKQRLVVLMEVDKLNIFTMELKSDKEIEKELLNDKNRSFYVNQPSWKEIVKRGADKNYNYDEKDYKEKKEELRKKGIEVYKANIGWKKSKVKSYIERIKSIENKIKKLNQ